MAVAGGEQRRADGERAGGEEVAAPDVVDAPGQQLRLGGVANARATWSGVRVSDLARLVEPTADAQYVDFAGFDEGYHESWDMESAMHPLTLVAYGMDNRMLSPAHGAPARVHSPVKLGYKNAKYLTRVVFMPARNGGYWSDRGYEWFGGT